MLRQEAVVPEMYSIIKEIQKVPLFQNHILVGGKITKLLFSHIANDRRLFENIIKGNNPPNQTEYAKGSLEVLSEACEKTIGFIKDENNTKDYINWFSSMQNLYIQMEDTFKYFPPGDFNDGLYVTSCGLAKSFEKAMKLIKESNRSDNR